MRNTGPVFKKSRRYGFSILETGKEFAKGKKRTSAPGQHGSRRKKLSNYGIQQQEKQKLRFLYGLSERQFRNTFIKARKLQGVTGENFFFLLESRLDNIVYRLGLAATRRASRQLVNHGHILVNNKKIDIPSYITKIGDEITVKEQSKKNVKILEALEINNSTLQFVEFNKKTLVGKYVRLPERSELSKEINEALIVEWYKRLV